MKKSVVQRVKITKKGKILRRAMILGHSRGNKSAIQKKRKKLERDLIIKSKILKRYL